MAITPAARKLAATRLKKALDVSPHTSGATNGAPIAPDTTLEYVRANLRPIVVSLLGSAAQCGEDSDWAGMRQYSELAARISQLEQNASGEATNIEEQPRSMAATN